MSKFLKKINRGVALGIIMLIGLIVFFIMDSAAFAKEEPELKDFLDEYLEECAKINLLPAQYREPGVSIPDEVIEAKTKEGKEFVEKYFTDYKRGNYYSDKENLLLTMGSVYKTNRDSKYAIKDFKYSLISISGIQKQSSNAVKIRFKANMTVSASPDAQFINMTHLEPFRYLESNGGSDVKDMSMEIEYTLVLFKVGDQWKIAYSEGYYTGAVRTVVVHN